MTVVRPNGVVTTNTYDPAGRLTDIAHKNAANATLANFHYTLDPNGNRTKLDQTVNGSTWTETYGLDTLDRLTSVNYSDTGQTTAYAYSPAGNRQSMSVSRAPVGNGTTVYTSDASQQLISIDGPGGSRTLGYDGNGNRVSDGLGATYTFDSQNRLTGITGTMMASHQFNADGVRVTADGVNQLWDQTSELPSLIEDGTSVQTFANDLLVARTDGASSEFPLADALGSVRLTTDSAGSVVGTSRYDVYGSPRSVVGSYSGFGFSGEQTDPTGLVNLRARFYDPALGQFLSADRVQPNAPLTAGFRLYGLPTANPVTHRDPSGLTAWKERTLLDKIFTLAWVGGSGIIVVEVGGRLVLKISPLNSLVAYMQCAFGLATVDTSGTSTVGQTGTKMADESKKSCKFAEKR